MPTLYITRGLPGSGKSTWAKAWAEENVGGRARVNRDDLRAMLHNSVFAGDVTERLVVAARDSLIAELLRRGIDVACDDTNLPARVVRDLARLAARSRATIEVHDFTHVPLQVCIERDAARPRSVGADVIQSMHRRFLAGRTLPLAVPVVEAPAMTLVPYTKPGTGRRAIIADVDGTLALMGNRSPYDESRVGEDQPNTPVINAVRSAAADGYEVIVMSARTTACEETTTLWLKQHLRVPFIGPFMRREGDRRRDAVVKLELFDEHVRDVFDIEYVFDDRGQVVRMWRDLGLPVFQVAEGDF
ncbi:5'-hydroxyl kinase [Nonomuraea turkmeniaca]|uniref:5'-hydroxyl kinase n=1 Tax=Nonomuraea turkmeniaca TaxID=103838 RepID=A0A5S4G7Z0_9ACTN|nr:AAA family ATPase [Nonomuraea turkmeniaca]TMR22070.1 5'-hydroxyl kinase [Nonomuraea turkmeniaca]